MEKSIGNIAMEHGFNNQASDVPYPISPFIADISEEELIRKNAFTQKQAPQYKQVSLFE